MSNLVMKTFRADRDSYKAVSEICKRSNITMSKFLREAMDEKIKRFFLEENGGEVFYFENPRLTIKGDYELKNIADAAYNFDLEIRRASLSLREKWDTKRLTEFTDKAYLNK